MPDGPLAVAGEGRLVALANGAGRGTSSERVPKRRRLKLSVKRCAPLKLQGSYMGHLRKPKPRQKAQVKALLVKKGNARGDRDCEEACNWVTVLSIAAAPPALA